MKKIVRSLMCFLPLLVLAACGGGGGSDPAPGTPGAAPTVTAVTPVDGAMGVIATTPVKVTFSKAMDPSTVIASTPTVNGTFTVSFTNMTTIIDPNTNTVVPFTRTNVIPGTLTADSTNKVFTFTPAPPSLPTAIDPVTGEHIPRTFTVTIKGGVNGQNGVKEAGGTVMVNNFVSTFTIWAGTQELGTVYDDTVNGTGTDGDGNVYMAGSTNGSLGATNGDGSGLTADILLVKYDANGARVWTQQVGSSPQVVNGFTVGGYYDDKALGFSVYNGSGNTSPQLVAAGYTNGTFSQTPQAQMNPDLSGNTPNYCVVTSDFDGTQPSIRTAQAGIGKSMFGNFSSVYSKANAVATDINGNIYVAGEADGNLRSGASSYTTNYQGGADVFVAKYDHNLNLQWTTLIGTTGDDFAFGIAVDAAGSAVYITGLTTGTLPNATGSGSVFVARFATFDGHNAWVRQFGTTPNDHGNAITVDNFNNIYVVGGTFGSLFGTNADNTATAGNTSDLFVVRFDATGSMASGWQRQLGTPFDDDAYGVVTDLAGNVYVTGTTFGGLDGNAGSGGADAFLVKYDINGNKQWTQQLGTPQDDVGNAVAKFSTGTANPVLYVAGYTAGNLLTNFNMDGTFNSTDYFLVKYDAVTGLRY
ncbi:MAG TPA: SBBP repeat-containing protein [Geobacteraceae bacterium]